MVQPIDYINRIPRPDLGGAAIQLSSVLRANKERDRALAAQEEAKAQAAAQQAQYRSDLESAYKSKKPEDFSALIAKYPGQREALVESWKILSPSQKEKQFREGLNLYQALRTAPEFGIRMLEDRIVAEQNAGNDTRDLELMLAQAKTDPDMAIGNLSLVLSAADTEKWAGINLERRKRDLEPYDRTKAAADAQKAAIESGFLESEKALQMERDGWNIQKTIEDVETSRLNRKLAVMQKTAKNTTDDLKARKLEEEIRKLENDRNTKIKDRMAEGEAKIRSYDNAMSTIDDALGFEEDVFDDVTGKFDDFFGNWQEDEVELGGIIDTIRSQTFINNVEQLSGTLTDEDAKQLMISIKNIDPGQNDASSLRKNLTRIKELLSQARQVAVDQYGAPITFEDRPNIITTEEEALKTLEANIPGLLQFLGTPKEEWMEQGITPDGNLVSPSGGRNLAVPIDGGNQVREIE